MSATCTPNSVPEHRFVPLEPDVRTSVAPEAAPPEAGFATLYDRYARFVWRALVRLGVADRDVEDVMQEVFLVVHRRLNDFRHESSLRTWVYGIVVHVARNYRRTGTRHQHDAPSARDSASSDGLPDHSERQPDALLAKAQAAKLLIDILNDLDQSSREVFVLAELEEMTAVEIGEVLSLNPNTVASRLRAARRAFEHAVKRNRARTEGWLR